MAARVRDEEKAKASGNAEDRRCLSLPAKEMGHILQGVMPADVFR